MSVSLHTEDVSFTKMLQRRASFKRGGTSSSRGVSVEKKGNLQGLLAILKNPLSILLVFVPAGIGAQHFIGEENSNKAMIVFWLNFVAMVPLANMLGDATEELAANLKNDMISGLLNATFGNAVEIIMSLAFISNYQYDILKASMVGSMLSNMLLVLGMSFFFGGLVKQKSMKKGGAKIKARQVLPTRAASETSAAPANGVGDAERIKRNKSCGTSPCCKRRAHLGDVQVAIHPSQRTLLGEEVGTIENNEDVGTIQNKEQHFNVLGALVNNTLLLMASFMLSLVTVFVLYFRQNKAYKNEYEVQMSRYSSILIILAYIAYLVFQLFTHQDMLGDAEKGEGAEDDEEEEPGLSLTASLLLLLAVTMVVAVCSEYLSGSLEDALKSSPIPLTQNFMGVILLPIIGNACEHVSAIRFAVDERVGLAVGIAVGSSVQIALFAIPFTVLAGWVMHPGENDLNMDLNFGMLHVVVVFLSVVVVKVVLMDGKANWLEGYLLMTAYLISAGLYYFS
mmetsp:Transcript_6169/g.11398  ORF Transcript_6169/g.11398 Transcript_6169/m.11398 type:complete len:509 (-) Transcript_6169:124-1650(-)